MADGRYCHECGKSACICPRYEGAGGARFISEGKGRTQTWRSLYLEGSEWKDVPAGHGLAENKWDAVILGQRWSAKQASEPEGLPFMDRDEETRRAYDAGRRQCASDLANLIEEHVWVSGGILEFAPPVGERSCVLEFLAAIGAFVMARNGEIATDIESKWNREAARSSAVVTKNNAVWFVPVRRSHLWYVPFRTFNEATDYWATVSDPSHADVPVCLTLVREGVNAA